MYRFRETIAFDSPEIFNQWTFGLHLQKTDFHFLNCDYSFRRGNNGHQEEQLTVTYYSDLLDRDEAFSLIEKELQILSFIALIPLTSLDVIRKAVDEVDEIGVLSVTGSTRKVSQLQEISNIILRQNRTRKLFLNVISTFNSALRHYYMNSYFMEDSYLGFFRVIEQVVSWSYAREERSGQLPGIRNRKRLSSAIKEQMPLWFSDYMGIHYTHDKYHILVDTLVENITGSTRDIYSKINRFCFKHEISLSPVQIQEFIDIRNSIAHGMVDDVTRLSESIFPIFKLAREIIAQQFFHRSYDDIVKIGYIRVWGASDKV